jgi:hypothetical protein
MTQNVNNDKLDQLLNGLLDLKPDWDSYKGDPPSLEVIEKLRVALNAIRSTFPPHHICASAEGGAAFCWFNSPKYADIEFLNDGSVLACTTNTNNDIQVWDVTDVAETANKISTWMFGEKGGAH